ncbi:MAG TPA: septum site-determining protein MinC [Thiolinea sp.]|nr:septum site-determining protein MinC [Thiolinea sp.]
MKLEIHAFDLKGEMSLFNVLFLHTVNMDDIAAGLEAKCHGTASQVLERSPVIMDCKYIAGEASDLDLRKLYDLVRETGLVPVGIRNFPEALEGQAVSAGWSLLRPGRSQPQGRPPESAGRAGETVTEKADTAPEAVREQTQRLMLIDRPVRSGQQIYCPEGDIVVLQHTSAGSELLAGGSVHVYGALRGRVLAGVQGDTDACIFCQQLEAELIAIAGRYRLLDEIEPHLKGKSVMVCLEDEKLKIVPI